MEQVGDGIVSAGTVNVFKMRLDHHLRNVRGYLSAFAVFPLPMAIHDVQLSSWMDPGILILVMNVSILWNHVFIYFEFALQIHQCGLMNLAHL